jgi:hypothetical protein
MQIPLSAKEKKTKETNHERKIWKVISAQTSPRWPRSASSVEEPGKVEKLAKVIIHNFDGNILSQLVWLDAQPLYIWSKIFSYFQNSWILLFLMIYKRSFYSPVFTEKSEIYDEDLHASLLRFDSLITTVSRIFVPNYDALSKLAYASI